MASFARPDSSVVARHARKDVVEWMVWNEIKVVAVDERGDVPAKAS